MTDALAGWGRDQDLEHTANLALALGVLNVVCFGPIAGVPAVVLGLRARDAGWRASLAVILGVTGSLLWTIGAVLFAYPWFVRWGVI